MWSTRQLALLSLALLAALGAAVVRDWPIVEMVAGIGLLVSCSMLAFRAFIDSLLVR